MCVCVCSHLGREANSDSWKETARGGQDNRNAPCLDDTGISFMPLSSKYPHIIIMVLLLPSGVAASSPQRPGKVAAAGRGQAGGGGHRQDVKNCLCQLVILFLSTSQNWVSFQRG